MFGEHQELLLITSFSPSCNSVLNDGHWISWNDDNTDALHKDLLSSLFRDRSQAIFP